MEAPIGPNDQSGTPIRGDEPAGMADDGKRTTTLDGKGDGSGRAPEPGPDDIFVPV